MVFCYLHLKMPKEEEKMTDHGQKKNSRGNRISGKLLTAAIVLATCIFFLPRQIAAQDNGIPLRPSQEVLPQAVSDGLVAAETVAEKLYQEMQDLSEISYIDVESQAEQVHLRHYSIQSGRAVDHNPAVLRAVLNWFARLRQENGENMVLVAAENYYFAFDRDTAEISFYNYPQSINRHLVTKLLPFKPEDQPNYYYLVYNRQRRVLQVYSFAKRYIRVGNQSSFQDKLMEFYEVYVMEEIEESTRDREILRRSRLFLDKVTGIRVLEEHERSGYVQLVEFLSRRQDMNFVARLDWHQQIIRMQLCLLTNAHVFNERYDETQRIIDDRYYPAGNYRRLGHEHEGNVDIGDTDFSFGFTK